jgi:hypothetical protein
MRTDPKTISDRTMLLIGALDRTSSPREVKQLCVDWFAWADQARVCRQIREHVLDKRKMLLAGMEPETRPMDRKSAAAADR